MSGGAAVVSRGPRAEECSGGDGVELGGRRCEGVRDVLMVLTD